MNSRHSPFSIEFYPPRTAEGESRLDAVHQQLARLNPDFFSVTYGAGGSTRAGTRRLVLKYMATGSTMAPHLSFRGTDEAEVLELLAAYKAAGINRLVALRGDIPSGSGASINHLNPGDRTMGRSGASVRSPKPGDRTMGLRGDNGSESGAAVHYRYASELVEFIRRETGDYFHIEVACYPEVHPEAKDFAADVDYFKQKVDAGANSAITQYFYNADAYFRFLDYCSSRGISIPIVPGIMPISNYENLARFSAKCGAEIPRWLGQRLEEFGDDLPGLRAFGLDVVTELCDRLLDGGAPGLHFYSMNLSGSVTGLWNNLSLPRR